ncbi:MAG TPA: SDR family oxidoreductase [Balneolales bacterium]|nr:SDR family oxidoreductase [Balneolales bacterium]
MAFEERSVVITGASKGVGERIALYFAKHSAHPLVLLARNKDGLENTQKLCHDTGATDVITFSCDLSNAEAVKEIQLPEKFKRVGVLVNNAGTFTTGPFSETTLEQLYKQFDINVATTFNTTQHFLPNLEDGGEKAFIINICSVASLRGKKNSSAYVTSKHATLGLTRSLRQELKDINIGVTAINLSSTYSTSWKGSGVDESRLIDPDDLAQIIHAITKLSSRTVVEEILIRPMQGDY